MRGVSALSSEWQARAIDLAGLEADVSGTLGRQATIAASSVDTVAHPDSPASSRVALEDALVELGPVLGEGGMGIVRLARQLGLRREVAVKQLHPEERSPDLARALLREAWISGNLEHPNIVPVHALSLADDGPMLVMKRIEGVPWSEVLASPSARRELSIDDPLEQNLEVLIHVCHSIHFAHDRGVLHLDIKPDNVMVGHFGEVYLLDWGIAASIGSDTLPWIPKTSMIRAIVGTPAYMSPEQAAGDGARFSVRTDVYLLGATLHHVVTGEPLHAGQSLRDVLEAAFASAPRPYPADVPAELSAIIGRATARDPEDRYPSADAFRRALEDFRRHRSSRQLTQQALYDLTAVEAAVAPASFERTRDGVELERDIDACRYAFQHALHVWPENPDALRGRETLLRLIVRHALRERDWRRAMAALEELDDPDPELAAQVAELRADIRKRDEKRVELEELERQMDLDTHRQTRSRVAFAAATTWLVWNLGCAYVHKTGLLVFDHRVLVSSAVSTFLLYGGVLVAVRGTLLATRVNRYAMLLLWASFAGVLPLWVGAAALGIEPLSAVALSLSGYVFFLVGMAITVDRRVLFTSPLVALACVFAVQNPAFAFEMNALSGFVIGGGLGWVWRRPDPRSSTV